MKSEPRKNSKPPRKKSEPRKLGLESLESRALMAGLHGDHGGASFGWGGARVDRGFDAVSYGYEYGTGYGNSGPGGRGHGGYADYHTNYVTYDEAPTVLQVRYLLVVMPGGDSPRGNRGLGEGEATSSRPAVGGTNLESSYRDLGSVGSGLSSSSLSNSGLSGSSLSFNSPGNSSLGNSPLNNSLASSYGGRDSGASLGLRSPLESSQPSSSGRDNSSPSVNAPSLNSSSINSSSINSSSSDSREAPRGGTSGSVSGGPTNVVVGSFSSTSTSGTSRVFGGAATDLGLAAQASSGATSSASDSFDSLSHGVSPSTERRSSIAGATAMSLSNRGKSSTGLGSALDSELTDGDTSGESRGGRGSSGDDWNDLFVDIAGLMDGRASQAEARQRVTTRGDRRSTARRDDLRWDAMNSDRNGADRAAQTRNNQSPTHTSRDAAQREFERQASLSRRADRDGRTQNGEQADDAQDAAGRSTPHDATFVYANDRRNAGRGGRQVAEHVGSRAVGGDVQSVVRLLDAQGGAGPTAWAQSVDDSLVELTHERRWLNGQEQGAKSATGSTTSRPLGALARRSLAVQVAAAQFGTSSRSDVSPSDVGQDGTQRIELLRSSDSGARHQVFEIDAGSGDVAGPVLPGAE
ncbi:MAG TPA: hypothetical protein PLV92_11160 [Pirellulaceae bacterium]|nr:hypothetical protein [Pirellulaceae bacterium]